MNELIAFGIVALVVMVLFVFAVLVVPFINILMEKYWDWIQRNFKI